MLSTAKHTQVYRSNTVISKLKHTETESAAFTSLSTGTPSAWHKEQDVLILDKRLGRSAQMLKISK